MNQLTLFDEPAAANQLPEPPEQTRIPFVPMPEAESIHGRQANYWLEWHDAMSRQTDDRRLPTVAELQSVTRDHAIRIGMDRISCNGSAGAHWADDGSAVIVPSGEHVPADQLTEDCCRCWLVWRTGRGEGGLNG
ncbi:hypothetical protein [Spirochaeta africana]|uniref:Uncharacterized protein n=1 Tax=Spirochaeta africana (strain ATCC 700263 / DSM 8902 / Z-7692) TaxID=889378 RepID=H9UJE7_SPIAZ|nr:hypothetical protein [Spirochaeta africana]AFG37640.1 hypothetical protein Spiaf_1581 [Spirochaeta africana DSM 8902]